MDKPIQVEVLDISNYSSDSFVFIYVAVGRMPPNRVGNYLKRIKESLTLCEKLDEMGIAYNLIPCSGQESSCIFRPITAEEVKKPVQGELELELAPIKKRNVFEIDVGDADFNCLVSKVNEMVEQKRNSEKFENSLEVIEK